jgi:putative tricarboxylic transport membrane protein
MGLVLLALLAFWLTRDVPGMDGPQFGPGTVPRMFALCLLLLSGTVAIWSVFTDGEAAGRFHFRGVIVVSISIIVFALLVERLGLALTTFVSFMIAALGTSETRWIEVTIVALLFTAASIFLFVYCLSLQFSVFPRFLQ